MFDPITIIATEPSRNGFLHPAQPPDITEPTRHGNPYNGRCRVST